MKSKTRVSYSRDLRAEAASLDRGLATISATFPNGDRVEVQVPVDLDELQFVKWAAVLLGRPDVRPLPTLEELVRRVCEERGIVE